MPSRQGDHRRSRGQSRGRRGAQGWSVGTAAQLACILEAYAPKPGNVHPGHSFSDTSFVDFVLSAVAIGPAINAVGRRGIGKTILAATEATRAAVGKNTNLGLVLLITPLAALGKIGSLECPRERQELRRRLRERLAKLTRDDARYVYAAIRAAAPGGLGTARNGDVTGEPTGTLLEMMRLARHRDLVARQYANGYREVIHEGLPALQGALQDGRSLSDAVVRCALELLAAHGDTLIARKCGEAMSAAAQERAADVLRAGWPDTQAGRRAFAKLKRWLETRDHRRNPGTIADLVGAVLFLALRGGIILQ